MAGPGSVLGAPVGDPRRRLGGVSAVGAAGVTVAAAGLTLLAGASGAAAGVAVGAVWYLFGSVYAVAAGHVVLGALGAGPPVALGAVAAVELGFVAALLDREWRERDWRTAGVFVLGGGAGWAVLTAVRSWTDSLSLAALAAVGTAAVIAYGLHRYLVVVVVGTATESEGTP